MDDILREFERTAAAASDESAELEMLLNQLVPKMTEPLKETLATIFLAEGMVAWHARQKGQPAPRKSIMGRWADRRNMDRFIGRLELALREILRRELTGGE